MFFGGFGGGIRSGDRCNAVVAPGDVRIGSVGVGLCLDGTT